MAKPGTLRCEKALNKLILTHNEESHRHANSNKISRLENFRFLTCFRFRSSHITVHVFGIRRFRAFSSCDVCKLLSTIYEITPLHPYRNTSYLMGREFLSDNALPASNTHARLLSVLSHRPACCRLPSKHRRCKPIQTAPTRRHRP